jgi:hypothetical protein
MEAVKVFPCLGCEKRHPLCHASCPAYTAFKQERERQLDAYRRERRGYDSAVAQAVNGAIRARRRQGKKY